MNNKTLGLLSALILSIGVLSPAHALAVAPENNGVLINEVMTASASSNKDEFIEIANVGESDVDLNGWTIEYLNSSGVSTLIHTFSSNTVIAKNGYLLGVLSQTPASEFLNNLSPKFEYVLGGAYGMAVSPAGLVLKNNSGDVIDSVSWTDKTSSADTNIVPGMVKAKSIERKIVDGKVANSGVPSSDFAVNNTPTPNVDNDISIIEPPIDPSPPTDIPADSGESNNDQTPSDNTNTTDPNADTTSNPTSDTNNNTDQPVNDIPQPTNNESLPQLPLIINELYIDPLSPLTDSDDEFVEIYNPNNSDVNISGYTLVAGSSGSYHHTFAANDVIGANSYKVITSKDTAIALSNSGGKVVLNDASGNAIASVIYDEAKPGEAWALDSNNNWQWTTTVTAGEINVITVALPPPVAVKAKAISTSTKKTTVATTKPKNTTTTTAKAASTKAPKATTVKAATDTKDYSKLVDAPVFVPIWLLALAGSLAVIYLGYEYRFEISNKIYQLRQYRANR